MVSHINLKVIGLMSGTSLDGLDLAYCHFIYEGKQWSFEIVAAETVAHSNVWKQRLLQLPTLSGIELTQASNDFGTLSGELVNRFLGKYGLPPPDFVASHGHTVFHQPEKGLTLQIGNGANLAGITGLPVVCDFRSMDVALGGQGAPLVPVGDRLLFSEYAYCVNLGGFANVSFKHQGERVAYDIGPANLPLNWLAGKKGLDYDRHGELSRSGNLHTALLEELNALPYFHLGFPKSLGREWLEEVYFPIVNRHHISIEDALATCTENIALQIGKTLSQNGQALLTGGGAFNSFLMERIEQHASVRLVVPDPKLIEFKEALLFGLLGVLRWNNQINVLSSVTGSKHDHSGGVIYMP